MRSIGKQVLLTMMVAAGLWLLVGVGQAVAAEPWWHIVTMSAPAAANGAEARVDVVISNVGDARTTGTYDEHFAEALSKDETKNFITVVDKLPAGVSATEVHLQGGGEGPGEYGGIGFEGKLKIFEFYGFKVPKLCTVSGQAASGETVQCAYGPQVWPYEQIIVEVTARVATGAGEGMNEVAVSGGGAPSASIAPSTVRWRSAVLRGTDL